MIKKKILLQKYLFIINIEVDNVLTLEYLVQRYLKIQLEIKEYNNKLLLENQQGYYSNTDCRYISDLHAINKVLSQKIKKIIKNSQYFKLLNKRYKNEILLDDQANSFFNKEIQNHVYIYNYLYNNIKYNYNNTFVNIEKIDYYLSNPSEAKRYDSWKLLQDTNSYYANYFEYMYIKLIHLRTLFSLDKGFHNYYQYNNYYSLFPSYYKQRILHYVNYKIMPIKINYEKFRGSHHKTKNLLPWNSKYYESECLQKFFSSEETIKLFKKILKKINLDFYNYFENMVESNSLDLLQKREKSNGAFCTILPKNRPFIFMNLSNTINDLIDLSHEFGHALHFNYSLQSQVHSSVLSYPKLEISEVASLTLELLILEELPEHYNDLKEKHYSNIIYTFSSSCMFDEFEKYAYTSPKINREKLREKFHNMMQKYNGSMFIQPYIFEMSNQWRFSKQLYIQPFYQSTYAIAQYISLNILNIYKNDKQKALEIFTTFLSCDNYESIQFLKKNLDLEFKETSLNQITNLIKSNMNIS